MELVKGICFFCSNSKVVSDTHNVRNTILTLFNGSDINEERLLHLRTPRVCHLCYHSFVLMKRTHDDILHSSSAEKVHENCHLCGNSEDVIKVLKWSHFDRIGKDYRGLIGNAVSNACSDCLYYLETKNSVKEKLIAAHPQLKPEFDFASNITNHSTPLRRTRTKAERKVPVEFIDLTDMNADINKFKPLKSDTELKKSRLINKDPKFMNQILVVKLQNLNNPLQKPNDVIKKSGPQKRVRFKDIHELEEEISNPPKRIRYKETRYHDNFTYDDKNRESKEELVEYEIKTAPRRSRYREYSEDNSSDSTDGRRKSYFKIKLTKKKPFPIKPFQSVLVKSPKSVLLKSPPPNVKSPLRSSVRIPLKSAPKSKTRYVKKRQTAGSHKSSIKPESPKTRITRSDFKNSLVINVERMKIPELNGVVDDEVEILSEDLLDSEDTLDPLRIDSSDSDDFQTEASVIEGRDWTDTIPKLHTVGDKLEDEIVFQNDIISDKKFPERNEHTIELDEENQGNSEDKTPKVNSDKRDVISISSGDENRTDIDTEIVKTKISANVGETLNEIKLFLAGTSEVGSNIDQLKGMHGESDKTDNSQYTDETNMVTDNGIEKSNEEEKKTDKSQFDENTVSVEKDSCDASDEQNGRDIEKVLCGTDENESQKEGGRITNSKDEEEAENIQEEEETEHSQEASQVENSEEGSQVENSEEESQAETSKEQEISQEEYSAEDKSASHENKSQEYENDNDGEDINFSIDDENSPTAVGSFETVSELDKTEESEEMREETEYNIGMSKRKRDENSLSDSNSPDKKKKKVTFSDDLSSD